MTVVVPIWSETRVSLAVIRLTLPIILWVGPRKTSQTASRARVEIKPKTITLRVTLHHMPTHGHGRLSSFYDVVEFTTITSACSWYFPQRSRATRFLAYAEIAGCTVLYDWCDLYILLRYSACIEVIREKKKQTNASLFYSPVYQHICVNNLTKVQTWNSIANRRNPFACTPPKGRWRSNDGWDCSITTITIVFSHQICSGTNS